MAFSFFPRVFGHGRASVSSPWDNAAPIRSELFGAERLEQHARSLAADQQVTARPPAVQPLRRRLDDNARVLLAAYRASAAEVEAGRRVLPAAEWLLDNYHLVDKQIREIRADLPADYYRQLPKLASGPFAGYPRVFGLAWGFVAHTDSHVDADVLRGFLVAYQHVQPLTIGELWAVAITVRIVLIENLRRLSDQITLGHASRSDADAVANRLMRPGTARTALDGNLAGSLPLPLPEIFAAQLAKRLRGHDPQTMPALGWLQEQLAQQDTTIEEVVARTQQRQGASNVSVRNVITSLKLMSDIDWARLVEHVSLVDALLCEGSDFAAMDFATRNRYRSVIETLARGSPCTELEIAAQVLSAGRAACTDQTDPRECARMADPGYHLIAQGRPALERAIGFKPALHFRLLGRGSRGLGLGVYAGAIGVVALAWLAVAMVWVPGGSTALRALWLMALLLPATEVATVLVNRLVVWRFGAVALPGLELAQGVPSALRTLVAVPTLLTSQEALLEQIERLEIHYLASGGGDLVFALLTDGLDAQSEEVPSDAPLLASAVQAIAALNQRHGPAPEGCRFLLLHRRRLFNAAENTWMGWERKRGKLHELNRLLRGATDTSFLAVAGPASCVPAGVRYVLTLDADTQLPRDAALRLVGKMAHPLNWPRLDVHLQRVVSGYGILQPRITPSLPLGQQGSWYQRVSSSAGGMDPYAMAISDVYQDLFGEGSYTGKGIYDVDAFEAALQGRVPDNSMLSHDLFEGIHARAGLASDIELVEEAPTRYDVAARRQHRWTRGDWQLLPWIVRFGKGSLAVPAVGRWKMLDNLRRSLLAPSVLLALVVAWLVPGPSAFGAMALVLATLAVPVLLPMAFALWPHRAGVRLRSHFLAWAGELGMAALQIFMATALLADQAWRMLDAIARTLVRLWVTRRRLLEWTTAAQAGSGPHLAPAGFYRQMAGGVALAVVLGGAAVLVSPGSWTLALPFVLLWLAAPALAWWGSRPWGRLHQSALQAVDAQALRLIARRTWRYFETFVTPADHMLPPDNFQRLPRPAVAHRTSPTNIGLYLLATVAARDFGWISLHETVERLEATFTTLHRLRRFKGHFFNWYDTSDLRALDPPYVSSVDSGNLAGHLIALANACEQWGERAAPPDARTGMADALQIAQETLAGLDAAGSARGRRVGRLLDDMASQLNRAQSVEALAPALGRTVEKAAEAASRLAQTEDEAAEDLVFWIEAVGRAATAAIEDARPVQSPRPLEARLQALADGARQMAVAMDFAFLVDPERKLLSIGYGLSEQRLDGNCYDLLASEARLASLFAIAKGDAPTRHWFRLGRTMTPVGYGAALVSWSGSMFEYLMPSLVMRAPLGSLLEQTNRLVVQRQIDYADSLGLPWGMSESGYNARDLEYTYQYSNFGVPGLGLKRGLADNRVIAPYATGLAAMVQPGAARRNYDRLAGMGALGGHGFYEALDFTPSRVPEKARVAIVRSFMAHHQGMTIVAIANVLHDGAMRARFHREPMIQASELLLQERVPRDVSVEGASLEQVMASAGEGAAQAPAVRCVPPSALGQAPVTHLLSNGHYTVMLTAAGAGYSRWRGLAVTRWSEDATRDPWGGFIYLRDLGSDQVWSATAQPLPGKAVHGDVLFMEDRATFSHHEGGLAATLEVIVSGESDGEVRRLSLANGGRRTRELDITSYAEMVLGEQAADQAHPAFFKLFVQTDYLPEFGALIATRRKRSPQEPTLWAAHFMVVEGDAMAEPQYESDRARFLGRGRDAATAVAVMQDQPLSNTVGTVLDAVFCLRQRIRIAPGGLARLAFWTVVASSREELLDLIDHHHDASAFERAATLAWTQAQVQLRHLAVDSDEAADFQRLAAPLLYADRRLRAKPELIASGAGAQSRLWPHGVSGDLPIVLLRIDDIEDMAQVRQLLRAHEYWRMKQLAVDLVILNERASSYVQDLQVAIETAVRTSQAGSRLGTDAAQGTVHTLRVDRLNAQERALLQSAARVELVARQGCIADRLAHLQQLQALPPATLAAPVVRAGRAAAPLPAQPRQGLEALEFFNGLGGFAQDSREYVVRLDGGQCTPAPWINVVANPGFGFQVSAEGSGATWCRNSRENQLTPWSNDPVSDPIGEAFYVRDEDTGALWSPTARPLPGAGPYEARHGHGYSRFTHEADGLALELLQYVPLDDPLKISRLTLHNRSGQRRRLSVTAYVEWVLGTARGASAPFIVTSVDAATGALLARKPWASAFAGRVAFADLGGRQTVWTCDRCEFLGRHGSTAAPAALLTDTPLSGASGAGLDPCAALGCPVVLAAGESAEIVFLLGQGATQQQAQELIVKYRNADLDAKLGQVTDHWSRVLGTVQVRTPDRAMDIMLNGWLQYQTIACRLWARSAFYQASGAYGFRDQLQDGMSLGLSLPQAVREHLLRAAGRQFIEGDVQHWWLPHTGQGVRTRISDDRVWLAYATALYIVATGDCGILDEPVDFLEGPVLHEGEADAFFQPMAAGQPASVFEHCARGLDQCLALTGRLGLPLIGTGDWNDGMNRVGAEGQGESVWLGWLLVRTIDLFVSLTQGRDEARAARWRTHAQSVREAIEREAWDGAWYRRATFDDGTWLGSQASEECRIDAIAQAWAVLSGAADPERAARAMDSLLEHLVLPEQRLALLLAPPFDTTAHDPGYIKGYPPGLRENGGQYSHAAMWAVLAWAEQGNGDQATALFGLLNPINHARTAEQAQRYKVEPYVLAADVYAREPHIGRGGWTWYTGAAGWMHRAGIEGILGLRREGACLRINPCIAAHWPGFEMQVVFEGTRYAIEVHNPCARSRGLSQALLDGKEVPHGPEGARLPLDGVPHRLVLTL